MEKEIKTVQDYLMAILPYQQRVLAQIHRYGADRPALLFRGDKQGVPLVAGFGRLVEAHKIPYKNILPFERNSLRMIQSYVNANGNYSDWDLITLAQHYGVATRFLDWTSNSLVALWFALNEKPTVDVSQKPKKTPVVWLLETNERDFDISEDERSPIPQKKGSETVIYTPRLIDSRISLQDNYLMRQVFEHIDAADYNVMKIRPVDKNPVFKCRCHSVTISNNDDYKEKMLDELEDCGYTKETVFPVSIWKTVKERFEELITDYTIQKEQN